MLTVLSGTATYAIDGPVLTLTNGTNGLQLRDDAGRRRRRRDHDDHRLTRERGSIGRRAGRTGRCRCCRRPRPGSRRSRRARRHRPTGRGAGRRSPPSAPPRSSPGSPACSSASPSATATPVRPPDRAAAAGGSGPGVLPVREVVDAVGPSIVTISSDVQLGRAVGTGVIVSADGEMLTNAHVVDGATTIHVRLAGETEPIDATVVASDRGNDLALLRIDRTGLRTGDVRPDVGGRARATRCWRSGSPSTSTAIPPSRSASCRRSTARSSPTRAPSTA